MLLLLLGDDAMHWVLAHHRGEVMRNCWFGQCCVGQYREGAGINGDFNSSIQSDDFACCFGFCDEC